MLNNKKIDLFLKLIKSNISSLLAIKIPNENNAFLSNQIAESCNALSINHKEVKNLKQALKKITISDKKVFLITGSLYLVGRIRSKLIN